MKHILKNTLLAIAVLSASQAYAARNTDAPVELPEYTVKGIASLPAPIHHPTPQVSAKLVGTNLILKLTIDEKGRPECVRLPRPLTSYSESDEMDFASQMRYLVRNWKFEPALDTHGNPVTVKVIMPVHVVKKGSGTTALASLILDTGDEDAS